MFIFTNSIDSINVKECRAICSTFTKLAKGLIQEEFHPRYLKLMSSLFILWDS